MKKSNKKCRKFQNCYFEVPSSVWHFKQLSGIVGLDGVSIYSSHNISFQIFLFKRQEPQPPRSSKIRAKEKDRILQRPLRVCLHHGSRSSLAPLKYVTGHRTSWRTTLATLRKIYKNDHGT